MLVGHCSSSLRVFKCLGNVDGLGGMDVVVRCNGDMMSELWVKFDNTTVVLSVADE